MRGLLIVADVSSLGEAAGALGMSLARRPGRADLPSFGEPGADDAAAGFLDAVHGHAQRLAGAATAGARSLQGYAIAFHQVGG
jgi:hypothetical protein